MSYEFYKVMHFLGLFMVFSALGGQFIQAITGGDAKTQKGRRWIGIFHGLGLLIAFIAGFGLLAKLSLGFPTWVLVKILIWLALGGIGAIAARKRNMAGILWVLTIALGMLAAVLAISKPF
ncbi:MAG: hypothetical protein NTX25_08495 [Proteobacteria bacterium]|nr:hypothetical protein [Pseudomonadota bacterium]